MTVTTTVISTARPSALTTVASEGGAGPPVNDYVMNAVSNDETNVGYIQLSTVGVGTNWQSGDSNQMIYSMWFKTSEPGGVFNTSFATTAGDAAIRYQHQWKNGNPSAGWRIQAGSTTSSNIGTLDTLDESFIKAEWHHIRSARNGSQWDVFIDGVGPQALNSVPNANNIPWDTLTLNLIAARNNIGARGQYGDVWVYAGQYLDFSIPSNLAKFIDTNGFPVFLGANGELPLGATPDIFLGDTMVAADWNSGTNLGTMTGVTQQFALFVDVK